MAGGTGATVSGGASASAAAAAGTLGQANAGTQASGSQHVGASALSKYPGVAEDITGSSPGPVRRQKSVRFREPGSADICSMNPKPLHTGSQDHHAHLVRAVEAPQSRPDSLAGGTAIKGSEIRDVWQALHVGDLAAVRRFLGEGHCTASSRDSAGHSVFWHLIACGHVSLALFVLECFPFGIEGGVDPLEIHPTRKDSLLHLLSRVALCGPEAAELFSRLAVKAAAGGLLISRNAAGESCLDVAAAAMNLWVVKLFFSNYPAAAQVLVGGPPADPATDRTAAGELQPLRRLMRRLPRQTPKPMQISGDKATVVGLGSQQRCLDLSKMMVADASTGIVPYADVAFETGPAAGTQQLFAHRAVVGARSPVLFQALQGVPLEPLPRHPGLCVCSFRVDPRISVDTWKRSLHFLYAGEVRSAPAHDLGQLTELLLACTLYQLPPPLLEFTQASLCSLIPNASPRALREIFEIVSAAPVADDLLSPLRETAAHWLLHSAHELISDGEPGEVCATMVRALEAIETVHTGMR